jgi:uncharacterized protein YgiM (DUF1202 family)
LSRWVRISAFIALFLLLSLSGSYAFAQQASPSPTPTPRGSYVVRDNIFVRGGPAESYLPVGSLRRGAPLIPLSRNEAATWILISYFRGFGWVRRDLGYWAVNIDALPVIDESNLTPTPIPGTESSPTFVAPTETPTGNWIDVGEMGAFVRTGPGLTYSIYGELQDGTTVIPVGRTSDSTWILLRLTSGFAWINRELVNWTDDLDSLPILELDALTPSATFTNTLTPTSTATSTTTTTPSVTPTSTNSSTPSATQTNTGTSTPSTTSTSTNTFTSTATQTNIPTDTATNIPSATPTVTASPSLTFAVQVLVATEVIATRTLVSPSATLVPPTATPSFTLTIAPTNTPSLTNTPILPTLTSTADATRTMIAQVVFGTQTANASVPTPTPLSVLTNTAASLPTLAFTLPVADASVFATVISDANATGTGVAVAVFASLTARADEAFVQPSQTVLTGTRTSASSTSITSAVEPPQQVGNSVPATITPGVPAEAIVGGGVVLLVLAYVGLYWRGLASLDRYKKGYVIQSCPVCGRGHLTVDTRQERTFGIPRGRYTVRCNECRSVLREAGDRRWRYAIDPIDNPALYERFNNKVLDEETLRKLEKQYGQPSRAPHVRSPAPPPKFLDDEER